MIYKRDYNKKYDNLKDFYFVPIVLAWEYLWVFDYRYSIIMIAHIRVCVIPWKDCIAKVEREKNYFCIV